MQITKAVKVEIQTCCLFLIKADEVCPATDPFLSGLTGVTLMSLPARAHFKPKALQLWLFPPLQPPAR